MAMQLLNKNSKRALHSYLRALLLAANRDTCGEVLDPHSSLDLVDILTAGAAGAHRGHLEV